MFKVFKSFAHFIATFAQKVVVVADKAKALEPVIEGATSLIPVYGPLALTAEQTGFAAVGELASVLKLGGTAAKQHLTDAGVDTQIIATVEDFLAKHGEVISLGAASVFTPAVAGEAVAAVASTVSTLTDAASTGIAA